MKQHNRAGLALMILVQTLLLVIAIRISAVDLKATTDVWGGIVTWLVGTLVGAAMLIAGKEG